MKYLSLFSGIGGFEYGIQQSRYHDTLECIGYSEIDSYAESIYKRHYPEHRAFGDITKIKTSDLPDFDLLVGGFPCQAFSVAGKRRGFSDTRGTLFFEIARILKDKRPRYFLLENVRGLLSHDHGKTFKTILAVLSDLGYDVTWEVYNSKNHGVPQNRERIYIKGYSRDRCGDEILSQGRANNENATKIGYWYKNGANKKILDTGSICGTLTASGRNGGANTMIYLNRIMKKGNVNPNGKSQSGNVYDTKGLSPTLCNTDYKAPVKVLEEKNIMKVGNFSSSDHHGKNVYSSEGLAPTLCSGSLAKNGLNIIEDNDEGWVDKDHQFYHVDGKRAVTVTKTKDMYCINTRQGGTRLKEKKHNYVLEKGYSVRKLTPRECERLQGFPDDWTLTGADGETISNTQRYKTCGNAVTTTVITHIFDNWDL